MNGQACLKTGNLGILDRKSVYLNSSEGNTSPKTKNKYFFIDLTTFWGIIKGRNGVVGFNITDTERNSSAYNRRSSEVVEIILIVFLCYSCCV